MAASIATTVLHASRLAADANPFGFHTPGVRHDWWMSRWTFMAVIVGASILRSIWQSHIGAVKRAAIAEHDRTIAATAQATPTAIAMTATTLPDATSAAATGARVER